MQNIPRTQTKNSERIRKTVLLAVLIAIMLLFSFTPIGYLKVGAIEITFMCIPVAVGAILLGPACGALLGAVFGVTSFVQCFGLSAFGTFLFSVQPVYTALVCILPRILCGYLTGLIFRAVAKHDKTKTLCYFAASLATPLLNTSLFMGALLLCFWHMDLFTAKMAEWGLPTGGVFIFLISFIGINGAIEAAVNFLAGGAVAKAVGSLQRRRA